MYAERGGEGLSYLFPIMFLYGSTIECQQ